MIPVWLLLNTRSPLGPQNSQKCIFWHIYENQLLIGRVACNQADHCIDVPVRPSVRQHFTAATLWGPDLRNSLPFTLDNDLYRQLRCGRCASNLLYWPWHFFRPFQKVTKNFDFSTSDLGWCHFVGTRSQKLFWPFTLDDDFYTKLRCRTCACNVLFWQWHFSDLSKRSQWFFDFST